MEEKIFIKDYLSKQPELQKELLEQMFSQEKPFWTAIDKLQTGISTKLVEFNETVKKLLNDLCEHYNIDDNGAPGSVLQKVKEKICEDLKNKNADVNDIVNQATNIINKTKNNNKSWGDTYFLPEDQSNSMKLKKYLLMQVLRSKAFSQNPLYKQSNSDDIPEKYKLSNHYEDAFNLLLELCDFIDDNTLSDQIKLQLETYKDGKDFGWLSDILYNQVIKQIIRKLIQKDILPKNMEFRNEISEEQAEKIIMALPSFDNLVEKRKMSLEQILNADDLFDFVGEDKLGDLEKVFVDVWTYSTELKNLNADKDKMDELGDLLLQRRIK